MASLFPEICYEWTRPQDIASQHLEVVRRSIVVTIGAGASFQIGALYKVPGDKAFIVQALTASFICNDASSMANHVALTSTLLGEANFVVGTPPAYTGVNGALRAFGWFGQHLIRPGVALSAIIAMQTAQIAAQPVELGLSGIAIPRGNILEA